MNEDEKAAALARIAARKTQSPKYQSVPELFSTPLIINPADPFNIAVQEVAAERREAGVENLPPLEEDQDELRVAERLAALQAEGIGAVAPTNVAKYNNLEGQVDKLIKSLEEIDPRKINER